MGKIIKISERLQERMDELGIRSGAELARMSGIGQKNISNYLNNHREPDYDTLGRLAETLDTNVAYFFGGNSALAEEDESVMLGCAVMVYEGILENKNPLSSENFEKGVERVYKKVMKARETGTDPIVAMVLDEMDGGPLVE